MNKYNPVKKLKRAINFSVDGIVIQFINYWTASYYSVLTFENSSVIKSSEWTNRILLILIIAIYYFTFEYLFGRTLGKIITKTKVISFTTNSKPTFMDISLRTAVSLFVPIDLLLFLFGYNLHDKLSETEVVDS